MEKTYALANGFKVSRDSSGVVVENSKGGRLASASHVTTEGNVIFGDVRLPAIHLDVAQDESSFERQVSKIGAIVGGEGVDVSKMSKKQRKKYNKGMKKRNKSYKGKRKNRSAKSTRSFRRSRR